MPQPVRLRDELGKGLEMGRQKTLTLYAPNNGVNEVTGVVAVPKYRYNITRITVYSGVAVGSGTNTLDIQKDPGTPANLVAQFDPDTIVAQAAPAVQTLIPAACRDIPGGTPITAAMVTDNGSASATPDVSITVHWEPALLGYDGEFLPTTYE